MNSRFSAEALFHQARGMPRAEQMAFLAAACGHDDELRAKVEALLAADAEAGSFLSDATLASKGPDAQDLQARGSSRFGLNDPHTPAEQPGQVIGRYKLLQQIGEGGFGSVWMAEQREPVKRRVAFKIIKLGMDTKQVIARFEAERQALAMMDHPNIAKVLDGGSTEIGRPYFVMELVRGTPITEYCDQQRLDTAARLKLFISTCHAVQHAHQKGIIHRDIKPSNVLVTLHDGVPVPKVIDFGIAKATNAELTTRTLFTEHRQMVGTPAYMSPEQAEMSGLDIDTRTDVYSLGVLLYELLTGTTPFESKSLLEAGLAGMMRIIREMEPPTPSMRLATLGETAARTAQQRHTEIRKLSTLIRGDLDWIVMHCLEKDRARRYETANVLAADIKRHLNNEPVLAGPPSALYRLKKLIKRNKGAFSALSAVFAVLALGAIGTTCGLISAARANTGLASANAKLDAALDDANNQWRRAEAESLRAQAAQADERVRAEELEQVAEFQASQLSGVDPASMGSRLRDDILDKRRGVLASRGLGEEAIAADLAELESSLAGVNFTSVALETLEENIFDRALEAIDERFADQPLIQARLLQTVAGTLRTLGLLERARRPQMKALDIRRRLLGDHDVRTLQSLDSMCVLLQDLGEFVQAEQCGNEAVAGFRRVLGDAHPQTLRAEHNLVPLLSARRKLAEAEHLCREVLDSRRRVLGDDHPDTLLSINALAVVLYQRGRFDEAEPYFRAALDGNRRILGNDHPTTLTSMHNLSSLLQLRNELAEAETYVAEAVAGSRRALGNYHPRTLHLINSMGSLLAQQGKLREAESHIQEALQIRRSVLGEEHPDTLGSMKALASLLRQQSRPAEAEGYYRECLAGQRRAFGAEDPRTLVLMDEFSQVLLKLGQAEEAEQLAREALQAVQRVLPNGHSHAAPFFTQHARTLVALERFGEAEACFMEAYKLYAEGVGTAKGPVISIMRELAALHDAWNAAEPNAGHDIEAADWRAKLARREPKSREP